ncbi:L,D-transpeptidase family protein [Rhizosphaericola mali]|uniref:L,D-transpeptidase n=1 Tax=Rhizosphaericola mali TaxID=2545455 RepID=A0A5P2FWY9_9BACT|nr:L,D-transpeptidase [Rhizosphaericola mali]QES87705.1 L,D-transpeptidase [Rhizosphaericola mali]
MFKLKITFFVLFFFVLHTSFLSVNILDNFLIVIDKDKYELNVFDTKGWLVTFPCVFGNKNQGDKMVEGDRKTPEGTFSIISKKKSKNWNSFLMLDYPTQADIQKFEQRKAEGLIPSSAKIGSAIGIHGTWPHEDYTIDQYQAWTDGCIALKNVDIEELYRITPLGAKVIIRK